MTASSIYDMGSAHSSRNLIRPNEYAAASGYRQILDTNQGSAAGFPPYYNNNEDEMYDDGDDDMSDGAGLSSNQSMAAAAGSSSSAGSARWHRPVLADPSQSSYRANHYSSHGLDEYGGGGSGGPRQRAEHRQHHAHRLPSHHSVDASSVPFYNFNQNLPPSNFCGYSPNSASGSATFPLPSPSNYEYNSMQSPSGMAYGSANPPPDHLMHMYPNLANR